MSITPLTQDALIAAIKLHGPGPLAAMSEARPETKVSRRTLERIRSRQQAPNAWTLDRMRKVLARLNRNEAKEPK